MTPERVQIPHDLNWHLEGLTSEQKPKLVPLVEEAVKIYDWSKNTLLANGLTPENAGVLSSQGSNRENSLDPIPSHHFEMAAEFRHVVHHVLGTALELKKHMILLNMPERVRVSDKDSG